MEARYRLGLQELHVVFWLLTQTNQDDEDFKLHKLEIPEFAAMIEVKAENQYKQLQKVTENLMRRILKINQPETNTTLQVAWLSSAKYHHGEGYVLLEFSPQLKPYLLQLKSQFTKIEISDAIGLRSVHAVRIFELLKQYKSIGKRTISIEELRDYCGIKKNEYKNYFDLKLKLIERAKTEINSKTDYEVDYREIKESRKVARLEWTIRDKDKPEVISSIDLSVCPLYAKLEKIGATSAKIRALLNTYGTEEIELALEELEKHQRVSRKTNYLEGILKTWEKNRSSANNSIFPIAPTLALEFDGEFSAYKKYLADKIGHPAYKSWFIDNGVEFVLQESGLFPTFSSQRVADHILLNYQNAMDQAWEETKDIYTGNV